MTKSFSEALKKFPKEQQAALLKTIKFAEELAPHAVRTIAWGMPTLKIGDDNLCHVMGFKNHNSLFPSSGSIATQFKKDLAKFQVSKGTIQFELNKPFPKPVLKKLLLARISQINESYPKKNGSFIEYYKNGGIKARGKFKGKAMHGKWEFFRQNGSIMRTGSFINGKQSGTWITYDAKGKVVKKSNFS
ncbi:MAG: hypothetical protein RL301_19 [Actinomycetota bacterium]|jgi:uncharacterized protein YdhG (YjbR/CyaY superfamily)